MEHEEKVKKYIQERGGVLEYEGKSKTIYALDNGNILMVFGDSYTGANGVEDPGANQNIGWQKGLGRRNLGISTYFFEEISKHLGIPTHIIETNVELGVVEVKRANTLGKNLKFGRDKKGNKYISLGLEFIGRNKAYGSFLQRHPNIHKLQDLRNSDKTPYTEVSVKNDEAGDPFFTRERHIIMGIPAEHFDKGVEYTAKICSFLTELFAKKGLELLDLKMEFGVDKDNNLILIDEISPGSLRASQNGVLLTKNQIYEIFMK